MSRYRECPIGDVFWPSVFAGNKSSVLFAVSCYVAVVMELVRLRDPTRMNVLGLLLQGFLQHALQNPRLRRRAESMSGNVWLRAGKMWATLCFDGRGIEIVRGRTPEHRAEVGGEMDALLGVVTGAGMVGPFLAGRIKIGGNPFFLLKMLPIITPKQDQK